MKTIVHVTMDVLCRFRCDMPRLNSLEFSRYLRMGFEYNILNKIRRENVAKCLFRIPSLAHYFTAA